MSSSRASSPPAPAPATLAKLRNALGLTAGWGVGMLAVSHRAPSASHEAATDESPATYEGVRGMLRKKKAWEAKAMRRAREERERKAREEQAQREAEGKGEEVEEEKKETAAERAKRIRAQLNELYVRQAELEKAVDLKWMKRIEAYEEKSYKEEEEMLRKLRETHDAELRVLEERVQKENDEDKKKMEEEIERIQEGRRKRHAAKAGGGESGKKRPRVEGGDSQDDGGEAADSGEEEEGEERELESAKKERELGHIMEEMNQLNKTKSQMVWLLKQVITAEAKMKMKAAKAGASK